MTIVDSTPAGPRTPPRVYKVAARDTVAVALEPLARGTVVEIEGERLTFVQDIPPHHKVALGDHAPAEEVVRFGAPIGRARQAIRAGEHVHVHNVATSLDGTLEYMYDAVGPRPVLEPATDELTFLGYVRDDGRVATRNEIWVIATVGCVGTTCEQIAARSRARAAGRIDAVRAITHPLGCSQLGDDLRSTREILAALANHPNAGGVVFVGLGCESNQVDALLQVATDLSPERFRVVRAQSEVDEVDAGLLAVEELMQVAEHDTRVRRPLSDLVVGLKCGGSDALSGLTANPLLGAVTDRLTNAGGSAILTEIPEVFGAERLLMNRASNRKVFEEIVGLVNSFKQYFLDHRQPIFENPSPGNKDGGITTLEEKSLGAVQKAGRAVVVDVRRYAERVRRRGLTLLEAPGNDAVSGTALTAAGATLILFTTGRGTPLGFPAPTVKIASNSELAARKSGWIDFNAGQVLSRPMDVVADDFMANLLAIASGQPTRCEDNSEGSIAIWKRGVTL